MRLLRRHGGRTVVAVGVALAVTAGVSIAAVPDSRGQVTFCFKKNGTVRLIDTAAESCASNETRVTLNQVGPTGPRGATGAQGAQGPLGPRGATGATGAQGSQGIQGPTGATGPTGADGADGTNGTNGTNGADGAPGATGATGATGPQGIQGIQGIQGPPGPQGPAGSSGSGGGLTSANGLYGISVTNSGIVLKGPGGYVKIDKGAVTVHGFPYIDIEGAQRP